MTKLLKSLACAGCAITLACGAGILGACSNGGVKKYTVTFDTDGGSAVESQKVEAGGYAVQPEDPEKDDYIFDGWYKDDECTTDFIFENEAINSDTTVYAGWLDASSTQTATATFYWNYEGAPDGGVYEEKEYASGGKLRKPSDPKRDGYTFGGWYMDEECTEAFVNNSVYEGDQKIYASWLSTYTLEAEDTQLTQIEDGVPGTVSNGLKIGFGSSSNIYGEQLIGEDKNASGGKAVRGLYYEGAYLDFEFTSDKAESGASLSIVISAEFRDISLTADTFEITVNGKAISYKTSPITANGNGLGDGVWGTGTHEYVEYVINNIDIQEGENVIRLQVANSNGIEGAGTVQAMAPIVDCIKIKSSSELEMHKYVNDNDA